MSKTIFCQKLKKDGMPLEGAPYPGKLGEKILNNISQEAWGMWLSHQTMLINEYRLNLLDKEAKKFLLDEMETFLFSDKDVKKPSGYMPPK